MSVGKIGPKIEECQPGAVQGCGNPNCNICLPKDGRSPGGALGGGGSDRPYGFIDTDKSAYLRSMAEDFSLDTQRRLLSSMLWSSMFSPKPPSLSIDIKVDEAAIITNKEPIDPAETERRKEAEALRAAEQEKRREREKMEREEKKAREPIEKYLLRAEHQIDWNDIVGNEEAHKAMIEAIEFPVRHGELYQFYGKKLTKGILLCGPPGCGKTMLGKAAASVIAKLHGKESSSLMSVKATELQQPFVSQTEAIIRNIFAYSRAYKALHGHQLVVFIDEADALLPSRDGIGTRRALPWEESNVSTFLTEMDGLEESGALMILATNRPHAIDSAVLRDGRCDRKITVRRPTEQAAKVIFAKALQAAPVVGDRDYLVEFAMQEFFSPLRHLLSIKTNLGTDFMNLGHIVSGAMMVGLVERAKANAFHRDIEAGTRSGITEPDILAAIDIMASENKDRVDIYAMKEFIDQLGNVEIIEVKAGLPEIKYTGTGTLQ